MKIIYKTIIVPLKCNKKDFEYIKNLNKVSADVWNYCVKIDKENCQKMTLSQLEFETKQKFPLHAGGIHHAIFKYIYARRGMWVSRKTNHKERGKVQLPYKEKKFLPTGWAGQSVNYKGKKGIIKLAGIKDRGQVICHVKSVPQNIAEIELVFKDKYYLAIKYKEPDNINLIQSNNIASIDLGEIHIITSIDNNKNCVIITNRKIRSLVRLKDKRQGELQSLRSRCSENSIQYNKYTKAIYKIKYEFDRKILDAIHKQTKLYLDWCIKNNISKVYYGDLDTTTRNTKGRKWKFTNHKLNLWRFGLIILQLENKLSRYGIKLIKINEAYSSQTCPVCGKRKKQTSRNYECKCGYKQHRDIVGAINILNFNTDCKLQRYIKKEYLQII